MPALSSPALSGTSPASPHCPRPSAEGSFGTRLPAIVPGHGAMPPLQAEPAPSWAFCKGRPVEAASRRDPLATAGRPASSASAGRPVLRAGARGALAKPAARSGPGRSLSLPDRGQLGAACGLDTLESLHGPLQVQPCLAAGWRMHPDLSAESQAGECIFFYPRLFFSVDFL